MCNIHDILVILHVVLKTQLRIVEIVDDFLQRRDGHEIGNFAIIIVAARDIAEFADVESFVCIGRVIGVREIFGISPLLWLVCSFFVFGIDRLIAIVLGKKERRFDGHEHGFFIVRESLEESDFIKAIDRVRG